MKIKPVRKTNKVVLEFDEFYASDVSIRAEVIDAAAPESLSDPAVEPFRETLDARIPRRLRRPERELLAREQVVPGAAHAS